MSVLNKTNLCGILVISVISCSVHAGNAALEARNSDSSKSVTDDSSNAVLIAVPLPSWMRAKMDSAMRMYPHIVEPEPLRFGCIRGTAYSCRGDSRVQFADIHLTLMPDSLDPESDEIGDMRIYREEGRTVRHTIADSMGVFRFDSLHCDFYQVEVSTDRLAKPYLPICGYAAIDFVRVAPDSISLTDIKQVDRMFAVVYSAQKWVPKFEAMRK
jgi:hypothetical protein